MKLFLVGLVFILLVLSSSIVWAMDAPSRAMGRVTTTVIRPVSVSVEEVVPVSVKVEKPLSEILVSYRAMEESRLLERGKYDVIKEKFLNSSASEKELLTAQLSQQRRRVLLSTLNSMTLIYQRADYLVGKLDFSLLALRAHYSKLRNKSSVPNFDSRMVALEGSLASLAMQSVSVATQLESAPSSIELGAKLLSIKTDLSKLIKDAKVFLREYSVLAQEVLSSS